MSIKGLGINKKPFIYLDNFCPETNWDEFHDEISYGLASCRWIKRFVSAGVHPKWEDKELSSYIIKDFLTENQKKLFETIDKRDTEKKIKFISLVTKSLHPFWSCYVRINRAKERTGIANKSVAEDCDWTENAQHFPKLLKLIEQMPFQEIGRVMFFITEPNNETVPHFDDLPSSSLRPNDDFIYFSTISESSKNIYVMDSESLEKFYPERNKKFLWFNEMDYHGTDPTDRLTFSIRIEGKFIPEVKKLITGN
jgi:hypothetical protein